MKEKQEVEVKSKQEDIMAKRKLVGQAKKELDFKERELDLRVRMFEFEKAHSNIIDGKPEWLISPEYMALTLEMKGMQIEGMSVGMKDDIARMKSFIKAKEKEITALERNHDVKEEVVIEEVKEGESE